MIVYDKTALDNSFLLDQAQDLKSSGFISNEQFATIKKNVIGLKTQNNLLVRFGFFLLGCILYSSIGGVVTLIIGALYHDSMEILLFIYSILGLGGLELLCRKNHYGYGLDDAFLLGFLFMLVVFIGVSSNGSELLIASILSIAAIFIYIRYIHLSSVLIACLASTATIAFASLELGSIGTNLLPFIIMLFATAVYFISKNSLNNFKKVYYYNGILLTNNFALILFYLSGNYLAVRELSVILLKKTIPNGQDIPFAIFFYGFTFVVPIVYLLFALKTRNRIMLWIGVLALVFSIYTIRFYYAILPIETALTLGGLLLFIFTYLAIKRIKENETGISFKPDRFSNSNALANAEIVLATAQFGIKPETVPDSPMKFGGGGFSGGGSEGSF